MTPREPAPPPAAVVAAPPAVPPLPVPPPPEVPKADPPPPKVTMTAAPDASLPAPRPLTTCRFADPAPPPPADDPVIFAVVRRDGGAAAGTTAGPAVVQRAIEDLCRTAARECQTEVTGERQVRVRLTVRAAADWQALYGRLQMLAELGNYGVVFQVRIRP
jgi:hypothetical protein